MRGRTFLLAVTLSLAFAAVANAQSFDNPKFEYTLDLPSPSWHLSSEPDDVSQAVEIINGQDRGGGLLSYEYTNGGKPMAGLIYYLQTDPRTIYTLRFTGRRDKLLLLRNQTDLSARSFKLK